MAKTKSGRWDYVKKHHADVWAVLKKLVDGEPWNKVMSDSQLTAAIRAEGCYSTDVITRDVRLKHGIGNREERRILAFARQHKKGTL